MNERGWEPEGRQDKHLGRSIRNMAVVETGEKPIAEQDFTKARCYAAHSSTALARTQRLVWLREQ